MVARPDAFHPGAGVNDHAGRLVAENERQGLREIAVDDVEVARADAARGDPDERLACLGRRQLDVEDLDAAPGFRRTAAFIRTGRAYRSQCS